MSIRKPFSFVGYSVFAVSLIALAAMSGVRAEHHGMDAATSAALDSAISGEHRSARFGALRAPWAREVAVSIVQTSA